MKLLYCIVLLCFSPVSAAMTRSGPPPTLFDYIDKSELVFYGIVNEVTQGTTEGVIQEPYTLIKFNSAQYIDGNGRHTFEHPVYLQYPGESLGVSPGMEAVYLLSDLQRHPRPYKTLHAESDSLHFYTQWDGSGIIQRLDDSGAIQFRKPYHSCKILNPLFERKEYECQMGDDTIRTWFPEDLDPPLTVEEFLGSIEAHLKGKRDYSQADFSKLYQPSLTPMLRENDLQASEVIDKFTIEMLKKLPVSERMLEQLNRRERARGRKGDYRNDPALVQKFAELDAQNQIQFEQEQIKREEQERAAQSEAASREIEEMARLEREIEQDGPAIVLKQTDASLSIDVSQLPNCSQLWRSLPLTGDEYYIGNCVRMDGQRVCTLVASSKEAGDNCTPLSQYVGGIITPPMQAFGGLPDSPWTPNEMRILHYGAGMSPDELAVVRQPPDSPPLFQGATPTQWNFYLRQTKTLPTYVPEELR